MNISVAQTGTEEAKYQKFATNWRLREMYISDGVSHQQT